MNRLLLFILFFTVLAEAQEKKDSITVYFNSNEVLLSDEGKNHLNALITTSERTVSSLIVHGFCDDIGSVQANQELSHKRAQTVADYLDKELELKVDSYEGKGEIELHSNAIHEEARKNNRRAIVFITYTEADKQIKTDDEYRSFNDTLTVGNKIIIENLIFKGSRTVFVNQPEAEAVLLKIATYFRENPTFCFEIQGHVCCINNNFQDARNKETGLDNLSEARAKLVYDYMLNQGIAKERMTYRGYGRQFPRRGFKEYENKRVEIVITKM